MGYNTPTVSTEENLLNGRYRLIEAIGAGGMAVVYKGIDTLLHRPIAVKILREAFASDPTFLARFHQEARSAARLDHPNAVTVYDVGRDGEQHYIVMEHVDGEDLKTLIRRMEKLGVDQAVDIALQIAAGVGHAHKMGIIHCDIKPHNVLITKEGVAKVTDFGIARALSESGLTDPDMIWGSPLYFSPEQAAGERPIPASDVYSIGVTLFEMLTGKPPFHAEKPTALALMHMREEPPPPSSFNPQVPPQLEWIVRKILAKEPSARYRTAEQLAVVLQEYKIHGEQVTGYYPIPDDSAAGVGGPTGGASDPPAAPPTGPAETDWRTWVLGAVAVIAVVGLIPLWALVYRAGTRPNGSNGLPSFATSTPTAAMVVVPDVQGRHWEDARADIEAVGLFYTLEEDAGANAPEGTIVRQDPAADETVPVDSDIILYVSGPTEMVQVPGVVDVPIETARNWLELSRFQTAVANPVWGTRPISTVIAQQPERGTQAPAGSVVTLTICGGTEVPISMGTNFGDVILLDEIELLQARVRPGETLGVSLHWRALEVVTTRYVVFVHLLGPTGGLAAQDDREPLNGLQPTNTWTPGVNLWDLRQIYVPPDAVPGVYQLRIGMYTDQGRLEVVDPGEASVESDSILIAEVEIGSP